MIADKLRHVDAGIAHDREAEAAVVRAGISRRHNNGFIAALGDRAAIIDDAFATPSVTGGNESLMRQMVLLDMEFSFV